MHTPQHIAQQCVDSGGCEHRESFLFESFLGNLKSNLKGPLGAIHQVAFAYAADLYLNHNSRSGNDEILLIGGFTIDRQTNTYGGNMVVDKNEIEILKKLIDKKLTISKASISFFTRYHQNITTYHSFFYKKRKTSCSYLVSLADNNIGWVICFLLVNQLPYAIVQSLKRCEKQTMSDIFVNSPYYDILKRYLDNIFTLCYIQYLDVQRTDSLLLVPCLKLRHRIAFVEFRNLFCCTEFCSAYQCN
ncbi:unnamed protein product [Didymodactylos carnosus]|uniref:Uncharacterized protein n=1 Tax=Didymodactylos carnosus TaxID=1234261 RepID=A0A8S2QKK9_9BILA|nr:unnamed protein product [Didymodactylos carnosus]CAF4118874.1 unnamed protein product [Didymodactylos carnosus]